MRVVVQRVAKSSVSIDGQLKATIGKGMMILLGIEESDNQEDIEWICGKLVHLRIFADQNDLMNLDILQVDGNFLVVSQFTLHASTKKGNRPSFIKAARPETAIPLYEKFIECLKMMSNRKVETGTFGANMQIELVNDGPVTIIIDSKNRE